MITQDNLSASTPMGATLIPGGATFRVWAPRAVGVYVNGTFGGTPLTGQTADLLLAENGQGHWTGFLPGATEGDLYRFFVVGTGSSGYKRDPYARELATDAPFPACSCILRSATAYPWHDAAFVTPDFADMIVYQLHIGTYAVATPDAVSNPNPGPSTFLDIVAKLPYLVALGINVLQPLPIDETETDPSMGYDGADYFSPDSPYIVTDPAALAAHLATINTLLKAKSQPALALTDIASGYAQVKALVDLCHLHGIAVAFDVVYNHTGGFTVDGVLDDASLYYFDRVPDVGDNNDSLYCTDQDRGTGGLAFALWNDDVRQFLINNAMYYIHEFHADGFRYDEISTLLSTSKRSGWSFCCDLTGTLRFLKPRLLQNAEFWPGEFGDFTVPREAILAPAAEGGAGFDVVQHDGLRSAVRVALQAAAEGAQAPVGLSTLAAGLFPAGCTHGWQAVTCVENHDLVFTGRDPRIPALADPADPRSWYARSRARFATGILLTAPGIPQLFMGQEFLEEKQWDIHPDPAHLIDWNGLATDSAMANHLRFTRDLIRLRWTQPALRGDNINPFHVNDSARVVAFHRWLDDPGRDIVVVATLSETTWYDYVIGFPSGGTWTEVFNSDIYDNWVNPVVAGNGGSISADGPPMDGLPTSAALVIPANGFVVFVRT